jgi:high-affinity iron transporter
MISLREGIEAFLIVAITLAYLRKTGRTALVSAVYWGTGAAALATIIAVVVFRLADEQPSSLVEGILASVASVTVLSLTIYMFRNAKKIRGDIAARIEAAAAKTSAAAWWGVFGFVLLMIVREGMETALVLTAYALQADTHDMFLGALIGVSGAAAIAWAWGRYGHRVNIARFLQVTAVFLVMFVVQLFIYSFHEFSEAGALPGLDNQYWHMTTEPYGPEGQYGQWLSYCMVIVPTVWLVFAWLKDRKSKRAGSPNRPAHHSA